MIIGVSGYGYTGSSAFVDLIKEYEEVKFIKDQKVLEFTIPYSSNGLLNLEYYLTKAVSKHVNGDNAIYRFLYMTDKLSGRMNRVTNGKFSQITEDYVRSLVQVEYRDHIVRERRSRISAYWEKILTKIQQLLEKRFKRYIPLLREQNRYICTYPEDFLGKTRKYIHDILEAAELVDGERPILLDQPFPPNDPSIVFHYFDDPYAIVVNRDPRDLYVLVKHLRFSGARFIPHDTVEDFVKYYRAVSGFNAEEDKSRVLRIQFEDLVYEYDSTVKTIEEFLRIEKHIARKKYFDPEISIKNTNMLDLFPEDRDDIAYIEKELPEYLFPFEKYGKVTDREGIYGVLSADRYNKNNS